MEKKQNVPVLRFQGFSGEWKTMFLGDMVEILSGIMGDSLLIDGKYRLTRIETIAAGIVDESRIGYTNSCPGDVYLLRKGDILYSNINSIEHIGKVAQYQGGTELYHGINLLRLIPGKLVLSDFLFQLLGTDKYRKWAKCHANQAVSQASINRTTLASQQISICNIQEQGKIGNFLRQLDNNIVLTRKKIQKLQQFRQAMLTKLFPREGAAEPELRFRGFSGKWERRNLLENFRRIIDFRGRTPKKLGMDWSTEGYLALSALNVKDGYIDFKQECHYGSQELYDKWMTGNELHKGQVVFTTEAPMGNVAQIPDDKKYILSQRTIAFEVKPDLINEDFLATLLRTPQMFQKLSALSSGGTAKGISQRSMEMVEAFFPTDILEQKKIGAFFKNLDSIISLQQKKLERMQRLKAALLEKLFV